MSAQAISVEQHLRDDEPHAVYRTFKIGPNPFLALNGERSQWGRRGQHGPSSLIFYVSGERAIQDLRCDEGRMLAEYRQRQRGLMNGLETFRERKLAETRATPETIPSS